MKPTTKNKQICKGCSLCCQHLGILISPPKTKEDLDMINWYILHKTRVYINHENEWVVELKRKCSALDQKGLCSIYPKRPKLCREYSQKDCDRNGYGDYFKVKFTNPEEFKVYIKKTPKLKKIR